MENGSRSVAWSLLILSADLEPVNILAVGYAGEDLTDPEQHSQLRIPVDELASYESL